MEDKPMMHTGEREYLRERIGDYLSEKGVPLDRAFRCLNPGHEDKHPSMGFNRGGGNVHCFSCGATYDLFDLIGFDYRLSGFPDKLSKARELYGDFKPFITFVEGGRDILPPISPSGGHPSPYLERRGVSAYTCRKFGVYELDGRVWFPIYKDGKKAGACGRALLDDIKPRYKNTSGALGIWNGDRLRTHIGSICITEGIIDALCLEDAGFPAISLCGSQNAPKMIKRLKEIMKICQKGMELEQDFILCGDPDGPGEKMNAALEKGLGGLGLKSAALPLLPEDGDVAELSLKNPGRLKDMVKAAVLLNSGCGETLNDDCGKKPKDLTSINNECAKSVEICGKPEGGEGAGNGGLPPSVADSLEGFFQSCMERGEKEDLSSGVAGLDKLLGGGIYPGLYVLGAASSVGKTSLTLQVADYISGEGRDVLFFSLEESRFELMAKSLSRVSFMTGNGVTAGDILRGGAALRRAAACAPVYEKMAAGLYITEGGGGIGPGEIRAAVEAHINAGGVPPVVVVDYLQILKPSDPRATDKQNTDRAVLALKRLSRDFDIPVLAISSFNRENYRQAVCMESFKESGAVEYSADVLLGLQLAGVGGRDFDLNAAKAANPRRLELVVLKNRRGAAYGKVPLIYDARFGAFSEGRGAVKIAAY
jgi:replicative DNA helicase